MNYPFKKILWQGSRGLPKTFPLCIQTNSAASIKESQKRITIILSSGESAAALFISTRLVYAPALDYIIISLPYIHCQIGTIQATVQKRTPYFLSVSIISSLLVRVSNSRSVVSPWYLKYLSKVIYCQVIGGNILGLPSLNALRFP